MIFRRIIELLLLGLLLLIDNIGGQDLPSACANDAVRYRMRGQKGSSFTWTVTGGIQTAKYGFGDSIDVKWNNLSGLHSLSCQEFVNGGCSTTPITIPVHVIGLSLNLGTTAYICDGQEITLNAGNKFTSYHWQDGSTGSSLVASSPGIYWVEISQGKCTIRDSVEVVKSASPVVNLGRDTSLCSSERLLLDAGNVGMVYHWSTGSNDQTIWANEGDGLIWVRVTTANNCSATDSLIIQPCKPVNYIFIPNVFTPNGDGQNDVWRIGGTQNFPEIIVTLFDRWGRLVYKSDPGYPKPWNGERNGKLLPMDAYFYIIDLKDGSEPLRGSVTMIP